MTRTLYRGLLWIHPAPFRRRFSAEMLWIFDEVTASASVAPLFGDGLVSLVRQWLIGYGTWKLAAAALGAMLHIGIVLSLIFGRKGL